MQPYKINLNTNMKSRFLICSLFPLLYGIGAYSQVPTYLHVNSALNNQQNRPAIIAGQTNGEIRGISGAGPAYDDGLLRLSAGGGTTAGTKCYIDISGYTSDATNERYENITFGTLAQERMRIDANGYVSIGTKNNFGYMFSVNGSAIFQRVVVKKAGTWPDYVFAADYKLPSLYEVEKYIQENKHLEGIPSAETIEKEHLDLGNMQAQMLKKLEEMTLYMIELKKENDALKQEIEKLKVK
jgi:hypothetical protein